MAQKTNTQIVVFRSALSLKGIKPFCTLNMTVLRVDVGGCSFGLLGLCYVTVVSVVLENKT